jgi:hypothetical protein
VYVVGRPFAVGCRCRKAAIEHVRREHRRCFRKLANGSLAPVTAPGAHRLLLWSAATGFALGLTVQLGFITHHVALAEPLLGANGAGLLVSATGMAAFAGRLLLARIVESSRCTATGLPDHGHPGGGAPGDLGWPTVPVIVVASLVYGYGIGHITTLGPVVIRREFGAAAFGATCGAAATAIQLTSSFGPASLGFLRDAFEGYGPGLAAAAGLTMMGCVALSIGRHFTQGEATRDRGPSSNRNPRYLARLTSVIERARPALTESRLTTRDAGDPCSRCPSSCRAPYGLLGGFTAMVRC